MTRTVELTVTPVTEKPKGNTRWGRALKRWEGSGAITAQPIHYQREGGYVRKGVRVVVSQDVRQTLVDYQDLRFSFPNLRERDGKSVIGIPSLIITDEWGEIVSVDLCLRTVTEDGVTEENLVGVSPRGDVGWALGSWQYGVACYENYQAHVVQLKDTRVREDERDRKVAEIEATPLDTYTERAIQRVREWLDTERPCPKTEADRWHNTFTYTDVRTFACDVMVRGMAEHFVAIAGRVKADTPLNHRFTDDSDPFTRISIAEAYADCVVTFSAYVHNENLALAGEAIKRFNDLARGL